MLDHALQKTFRNLSTLVLLACVITLPVHLIHAFLFKDVLSVAELRPEISEMPAGRQVRGVAKGDFDAERNTALLVLGVEILLLPLFFRASRRVMDQDDAGRVPTVVDAWKHLGSEGTKLEGGPILVATLIGIAAGGLVFLIGRALADMSSADLAWLLTGASRGVATATAIALVVGTAAALPPKSPAARPVEKLDLY